MLCNYDSFDPVWILVQEISFYGGLILWRHFRKTLRGVDCRMLLKMTAYATNV